MIRIRTSQLVVTLIALLAPTQAFAGGAPGVVQVPDDVPTIQAGIELVASGGEVIVAVGTYAESLDFGGKALTLRSSNPGHPLVVAATVIDVTGMFNVTAVLCISGEGPDTILDGFTITGGGGAVGGGMRILSSDPLVTRCVFLDNIGIDGGGVFACDSQAVLRGCSFIDNGSADTGGGLVAEESALQVIGCTFRGNRAITGGGIYSDNSDCLVLNTVFQENVAYTIFGIAGAGGAMANFDSLPTIVNCLFVGNTAQGSGFGGGGALYNRDSSPVIANSTFVGNAGELFGDAGALYSRGAGTTDVDNCIFRGNGLPQIVSDFGAVTSVDWSDVQGGWPGTGNVDVDPLFVDADGPDDDATTFDDNDYRLRSDSPCIDAGDTNAVPGGARVDLDRKPRYVPDPSTPDTGNGGPRVVDMGAYEFQPPLEAEEQGHATSLKPL